MICAGVRLIQCLSTVPYTSRNSVERTGVEAAPCQLLQRAVATDVRPDVSGRYTATGFAHAFLPTVSVTSTRT